MVFDFMIFEKNLLGIVVDTLLLCNIILLNRGSKVL